MKTSVLMVCLGNICRSPLAEGILKNKLNDDNIFVDSAGTAGFHIGDYPDPRSIAVAKKYGINISTQQCRKFSQDDFIKFDVIYAMDKCNYKNITALTSDKDHIAKVKLLLSETNLPSKEVPDPYYGGDQGFDDVYKMIAIACDNIVHKIKHNN